MPDQKADTEIGHFPRPPLTKAPTAANAVSQEDRIPQEADAPAKAIDPEPGPPDTFEDKTIVKVTTSLMTTPDPGSLEVNHVRSKPQHSPVELPGT